MSEMIILITQFDADGKPISTEPVVATVVNTPEELAALLDNTVARGTTEHGAN